MNKKTIAIMSIVVVLIGALYFGNMFLFKDKSDNAEIDTNYTDTDEYVGSGDEENSTNEENTDLSLGDLAPDFTLKSLDGKELSLSDFKGKKVLLNFWSTECKFCDIEMPDLNEIDKENEDVVVLAVNVMEKESKVKDYIEKGGYGFKVVLDESGDIARKYLIGGFPTSYFIGKEGNISARVPGMIPREQMEIILESMDEKE